MQSEAAVGFSLIQLEIDIALTRMESVAGFCFCAWLCWPACPSVDIDWKT